MELENLRKAYSYVYALMTMIPLRPSKINIVNDIHIGNKKD